MPGLYLSSSVVYMRCARIYWRNCSASWRRRSAVEESRDGSGDEDGGDGVVNEVRMRWRRAEEDRVFGAEGWGGSSRRRER